MCGLEVALESDTATALPSRQPFPCIERCFPVAGLYGGLASAAESARSGRCAGSLRPPALAVRAEVVDGLGL